MVISDKNKGSYFLLEVVITNFTRMNNNLLRNFERELDIVLAAITATNNVYKFESHKQDRVLYLFSTAGRKRKGQLERLIEQSLNKKGLIEEYKVTGLLKSEFKVYLEQLKRKENLRLLSEPMNFDGYQGNDLKVFEDKEKWFKWQQEVYDMLFFKTGNVKEPDPRTIITLYDPEGNTGKSSFFKYLYFTHPDKIARISYGSAQQLRSSLVNLSAHKIYIVDLTRTKGKNDSEIDLISVLEDLKNGVVFNAMYGSGNNLLMEPPHIIVSANFVPKMNLLSKDRWKIYRIKNKKLTDITTSEIIKQNAQELKKK